MGRETISRIAIAAYPSGKELDAAISRLGSAGPDEFIEFRGEEFVTTVRRSQIVDWFATSTDDVAVARGVLDKHDLWFVTSVPLRIRKSLRFAERYEMGSKGLFTAVPAEFGD